MVQILERLANNLVDTNDENRFDQILDEFNTVCSTFTHEMENRIDVTQQQPSKRQKTNVDGLDDNDSIESKRKQNLSLLKKQLS